MFKRPKPCETEEDLLKEAEKLAQMKDFQPAAKLVALNKRKNEADSTKPSDQRTKSRFLQSRSKKKKENLTDTTVLSEAMSKIEKVSACTTGFVVVRNVSSLQSYCEKPQKNADTTGFPEAMKLNDVSKVPDKENTSIKKKSLYQIQWEKEHLTTEVSCQLEDEEMKISAESVNSTSCSSKFGDRSFIVKGNVGEAKTIHEENVKLLSSMSNEQILAEQKECLNVLSKEQIEFLRQIRKNKSQIPEKSNEAKKCDNSVSFMETDCDEASEEKCKIDLNELPIDPKEAKKWLNMDKIEFDKMKWMTDLPEIKTLKNNEEWVARFNFEGDLLPYDAEIDVRQGLHHHEDEPERAGYTLNKLFEFARSTFSQQRPIGLRTLANILRNCKEGCYDNCFDTPLVQLMVNAGVVFILRFALDDLTSRVYQEALRGIYYLISSEPDEKCLDLVEPWVPLGVQPGVSSSTYSNETTQVELEEEEEELKDVEILKLDVVKALIRMDCHLRLRYLLETHHSTPTDIIHILGIFTRIARHSLTASWTLINTPRLIQFIVDNFLPESLNSLFTEVPIRQMSTVYGIPLWHAVRLMRVFASCGREIAAKLVNTYNLSIRLSIYTSIQPEEIKVPLQESLKLSQESFCLWKTLLRYGLTKPQEEFKKYQPMLLRHLLFYRDKVSINEKVDENKLNYDIGAQLISTITSAHHVAATTSLLTSRMKTNQASVISNGKAEVIKPPEIDWEDISEFSSFIEQCLIKWLTELTRCNEASFSVLRLIGSACDFMNAYLTKWRDQKNYSGDVSFKKMKDMFKILSTFMQSEMFSKMLKNITSYSALCSNLKSGTQRDSNNLGSLGCVTWEGKLNPVIQTGTSFPLLLPISSLVLTLLTLNPSLESNDVSQFLDSVVMKIYLSKFLETNCNLQSQWLTRIEVYWLFNICQLSSLVECSRSLYHNVALLLLACIHIGDEHLVKPLFLNIICNSDFVKDVFEVDSTINSLDVKDWIPLKSPAIAQPIIYPSQLLKSLGESLSSIGSCMQKNLIPYKLYEESNVLKSCIPFLTLNLTIFLEENNLVLDEYFPILPLKAIITLRREKLKANKDKEIPYESDQSSPELILLAKHCLQMSYLLIKYRNNVTLSHTNITGWVRHIALVFLAANDLFLDAEVSSYLQGCLIELFKNNGYRKIDWNLRFEGLTSCYDWYRQLLQQFMDVSYGDYTFALFVLIPLQQYWPKEYRKLFWGDMCDVLPLIRLSEDHIKDFIPIDQFLYPDETDKDFFKLYRSGNSMGLTHVRTPLLYKVAQHHMQQFMKNKI